MKKYCLNTHTHTHTHTHIYIYCHPQTDCFILSEFFYQNSVARHVGRLKPGSKPVQLYVRLTLRPLDQQVYHDGLGNYKVLYRNSSSSICLFIFLYPTSYQSAQFFQRALHYASSILRQSAQLPWGERIYCHPQIYIYIYIYKLIYIYIYIYIYEFTSPSYWPVWDSKLVFKQGLTGLNSEFSFS